MGARSSRSLPVGPRASVCPIICSVLPPDGLARITIHFLRSRCEDSDAFGETPKAADEDVRAPQSIYIVVCQPEMTSFGNNDPIVALAVIWRIGIGERDCAVSVDEGGDVFPID